MGAMRSAGRVLAALCLSACANPSPRVGADGPILFETALLRAVGGRTLIRTEPEAVSELVLGDDGAASLRIVPADGSAGQAGGDANAEAWTGYWEWRREGLCAAFAAPDEAPGAIPGSGGAASCFGVSTQPGGLRLTGGGALAGFWAFGPPLRPLRASG